MADRLSKNKVSQYKMAFDLFDRDDTNTLAIKVEMECDVGFGNIDEEFGRESNGRRVGLNY